MILVVPEHHRADLATSRNGEGLDNCRQVPSLNLLHQRVVALPVRLESVDFCRRTGRTRKQACRVAYVRSNVENVAFEKEFRPVPDQKPKGLHTVFYRESTRR